MGQAGDFTDRIEITPAMIEAGINAVHPLDGPLLLPSELAILIFTAMLKASKGGIPYACENH